MRVRASHREGNHPARLVVLYDGDCALCRSTAEKLRRRDRDRRLDLVALQAAGVSGRFPQVDPRRAMQEMQAVDAAGRVYAGVDAMARIGAELPGLHLVAWLIRIPGLHAVAAWCYRWVARNRSRWNRDACADGACSR